MDRKYNVKRAERLWQIVDRAVMDLKQEVQSGRFEGYTGRERCRAIDRVVGNLAADVQAEYRRAYRISSTPRDTRSGNLFDGGK